MWNQKRIFGLSSVNLIILLAALVKFSIHLYIAPGYGFFGDELYTIALSKHLAFGYVDLPPLVPALVAFSRAFGPDTPDTRRRALLVMRVVYALILLLGAGFAYAAFSTTPIQYRVAVQASIFVALGAGGLLTTRAAR